MTQPSIYQKNIQVIESRYTEIADLLQKIDVDYSRFELIQGHNSSLICDGIQICSSYDSQAEAHLIASQVPVGAQISHIYGVGSGEVVSLLSEKGSNVTVYIFNIMLFKVALEVFDYQNWLNKSNVKLVLASASHHVNKPFVAIPAELVVSDDSAATLRDRVCLELDTAFISHSRSFNNLEVSSAIDNNRENITRGLDIKSFPLVPNKPVVVAGAGPTLSFAMHWLKEKTQKKEIILFAVDAAVKPLAESNIKPDLIISIDKIGGALFGEIPSDFYQDIPLLYFPLLDANFVENWPAQTYVSFSTGASFDELAKLSSHTRLYSGGSVIHPSIDAAVKLGASEIVLVGADFSFINDQRHAEFTQQFSHFNPLQPKDCKHWVLNGYGEKNPTYLNYRGYLRDLEHYVELHPKVKFYNTNLAGAHIAGTELWPELTS
jgi:hypothetical protein